MALSKSPYRGTRDLFPQDKRKQQYIFDVMRTTAESFCFEPYDGPLLEEVDLYRAKSGTELINEQIYAFIDRGEREVAIRPEMTPTLARMVAQIHREVAKPLRWYAIPNLMRYEKPQRGRLREHWQLNCDIFGAPENLGEVEILQVAVALLKNFGANQNHFEILLNDRRVVDAIFKMAMQLTDEQCYKLYKVVDRSKKVTAEALEKMCDEILNPQQKQIFLQYIQLKNFGELTNLLSKLNLNDHAKSFLQFVELCQQSELKDFITYDPTIVRGLDYYTGVVFEIFDKHPDNRRALCGGGAYANLLQIFNEEPLAGIGFGLGDVTLLDFLQSHGLIDNYAHQNSNLLITYQDEAQWKIANQLAQDLRANELQIEFHLGEAKLKKAFQIAEKKQHQFIALIGESEAANGEVQIKNQKTRDAKNFKLNDIKNIIDFLKAN
jgi:histidyl-tRNA synthetase